MPHIHEKYDFTVGCFIVFGDKVLLVNHPRYGVWLCPGGHIELDEDPEEALFREIREETGIDVEIIAPKPSAPSKDTKYIYIPSYISVHDANPPHKHIGLTYYARAKSANNVKSDEHTHTRWFSAEELDMKEYEMPEEIRHFGREAIKTVQNT
ncbi:MAG TPA: NUDIX domain-containing protein [Candidatus Saccharimonadales bacterium]|nr:NUDIX domain-containing protein [Candidatus Saccharimonadales bacterium]